MLVLKELGGERWDLPRSEHQKSPRRGEGSDLDGGFLPHGESFIAGR
jgi:hypothetical protein